MKKLERLKFIYSALKKEKLSVDEILVSINNEVTLSKRQLQRDIKEINWILQHNDKLITFRDSKRIKSFQIIDFAKNTTKYKKSIFSNQIRKTNFFESKLVSNDRKLIENINSAISKNFTISIKKLNLDATGDNYSFSQRNINFKPIELIYHRGTYYIGGYNILKKTIQFFDLNQIKEYELLDMQIIDPTIIEKFEKELKIRFGVSKNINDEIYNIKLEFSSVTGNFVMNHFWHGSQSFEIKKGKIFMKLNCGINRELIGWIFYWMYNVKIIEPPILIEYYQKAINEIQLINSSEYPLVYRNIFNPRK